MQIECSVSDWQKRGNQVWTGMVDTGLGSIGYTG